MTASNYFIDRDCIIHPSAKIEDGVSIGPRSLLQGENIIIRAGARLDSGCIVVGNVTIGSGAWVRAGSVVFSSVPPNAIVQGNPAQVTGYQSKLGSPNLFMQPLAHLNTAVRCTDRPLSLPLGVGDSSLYLLREHSDARGSLVVGEIPSEVPFLPQRFFIIHSVPSFELRGEHAHRLCHQFLICLCGSVHVLLDDGTNRCETILDSPSLGLYMPAMIWGTQYKYSRDALLMVFASLPYSSDDYIRDYNEYTSLQSSISQ